MLKSIQIKNFKSYKEAELPLSSLTVLIGANASGKSNAIEAMRFLSWLAHKQKLSSYRYSARNEANLVRGKITDLMYCGGTSFGLGCTLAEQEYSNLSIELALRKDDLHIIHESIESPNKKLPLYLLDVAAKGQHSDVDVAYDNFSKGKNKPFITCNDQTAIFTQLTSPAAFDIKHKTSKSTIPQITGLYEKLLSSILFLDPVPARMRDYSNASDKIIEGDARNLSSALSYLWTSTDSPNEFTRNENRKHILEFIKSLPEQDIQSLDFLIEPRGDVMVRLKETFGNVTRDYDASLLSDGTLRVLAIITALLTAQKDSMVVIEEIDNGVHPSRAHHLLMKIKDIAEKRNLRVLLTTHNPAMLDALPDTALPDVVFCYRDPEDGSSRLVKLDNFPDYPELIAQGTLGTLVTKGILDRVVKNAVSPEDKKAKALDWLNRVKSGGSK